MNTSKSPRTRLVAALLVGLLAAGGVGLWLHLHEAHGHAHDHGAPDASALTLNNGQRWATDQPLRTGMQRIREAAALVVPPAAPSPVAPATAQQFAAVVQESVAYVVQNCKLEPKADAALHVIITDLMSGAGLLARDPASAEGLSLITRALQRYPDYFVHPGWTPLAAGETRG